MGYKYKKVTAKYFLTRYKIRVVRYKFTIFRRKVIIVRYKLTVVRKSYNSEIQSFIPWWNRTERCKSRIQKKKILRYKLCQNV